MNKTVKIIGAGLAGCEAAYQLAKRGVKVKLYDIKPEKFTPAHHNPKFGELVCSNSLKSNQLSTAGGLLKEELRVLDSLIIKIADESAVPAGSALAVDREIFADKIHEYITNCENIEVVCDEVSTWQNDELTIIATGPLTTESLSNTMSEKLGLNLHFYDAEAPIIAGDSIDYSLTFTADRYGKGESDYVNCPMNKEEYTAFYEALVSAECAVLKNFEKKEIFEGCMPVEVMASRGKDTLRYGPLRPVGLVCDDGTRPFAVVQLRKESNQNNLYNIVGFQTNLKFGEQKRVFSMIPALKDAEFIKYGVMHRNSYICAPKYLNTDFSVKGNENLIIAGQLSGVEGYMESTASGLVAGMCLANKILGKTIENLPKTTIIGAIINYLVSAGAENFQPMNANFGILPPLDEKIRDKALKKQAYSNRAIADMKAYKERL